MSRRIPPALTHDEWEGGSVCDGPRELVWGTGIVEIRTNDGEVSLSSNRMHRALIAACNDALHPDLAITPEDVAAITNLAHGRRDPDDVDITLRVAEKLAAILPPADL